MLLCVRRWLGRGANGIHCLRDCFPIRAGELLIGSPPFSQTPFRTFRRDVCDRGVAVSLALRLLAQKLFTSNSVSLLFSLYRRARSAGVRAISEVKNDAFIDKQLRNMLNHKAFIILHVIQTYYAVSLGLTCQSYWVSEDRVIDSSWWKQ